MKDTYKTLTGESYGEFRDRGSKFFAYAAPVYSQEEWQVFLEKVKKEHPKARHHCYAYRLGMTGDQFSETLKESFAMYPKKEVAVGDSWTVGQEMSLGALSPEPLIANTTYTLSGYEELDASKVAKITFTGEIDGSMNMGGAKMTVKTEKFEGVVYHDLKLNVPRLSISEISMTIAVPEGAEGKGIGSIPMDIKVTQKLIEVK